MKPSPPKLPESETIGSHSDLLGLVSLLAFHLAVELDFNYEDQDNTILQDEVQALEAAVAALLINGRLGPEVVTHAIERFMV